MLPSDGYGAFSALRGVRQKSAVRRSYEVRPEVDRELFPKGCECLNMGKGKRNVLIQKQGEFRDALWKICCDDSILAGHHKLLAALANFVLNISALLF